MSLPESLAAYEDCMKLWDLAVRSERGARACFKTRSLAERYRLRMNMARKIDRDQSKQVFSPDDPQWGKSVYNKFKITIEQDTGDPERGLPPEWWVYVVPHGQEILDMQSLDEVADDDGVAA